ncbi:MAG: hypothetical protein ACLPVF_05110 [Acidimicrobiales bacterium]
MGSAIVGTTNGGATWSVQGASLAGQPFYGISCPSASVCEAVGAGSDTDGGSGVFQTVNGGVTWSHQIVPGQGLSLNSVSCASVSTCVLVGQTVEGALGVIIGTTDGGASWWENEKTEDFNAASLYSVSCPSQEVCEVSGIDGSYGEIFGTTNDGATWSTQLSGITPEYLYSISCASVDSCEAVGAGGNGSDDENTPIGDVASTTDGGATWAVQEFPEAAGGLFGVSCASTICVTTGATAYEGGAGLLFGTDDGGAKWTSGNLGTQVPPLNGVSCLSSGSCEAAAGATDSQGTWVAGAMIGSTNAGATWTVQSVPGNTEMSGVDCLSATTCVAAGGVYADLFGGLPNATVLETVNGGSTWQPESVPPNLQALLSVDCPTTTKCEAVGGSNADETSNIIGTGATSGPWESQPDPATSFPLYSVACVSATVCDATGGGLGFSDVIGTTDGGAAWNVLVQVGPGVLLTGIACTSATTCEAAGSSNGQGVVLSTSDGWSNWAAATPSNVAAVNAITCTSATACTAVGSDQGGPATSLFTTDAGASWVALGVPGNVADLSAVACSSSSACVATGTNSAGGGVAIALEPSPPPAPGPYTPLTPTRICDTRPGNPSGLSGAAAQCNGPGNTGDTIAAGSTLNLNVAGSFGVPSDASAVVLNVTAVSPSAPGFLSVYPAGASPPTATNLNYTAGEVIPNLVEVGTGISGEVSLYSLAKSDVVVDVEGYVAPTAAGGPGAGLYDPLSTPARICDTRAGNPSRLSGGEAQCNGGTGNPGERIVSGGGTISVQVTGNAGVPAGAAAAVLNVTAVNPGATGHLTVYAKGSARPVASNVNYGPGQTSANRVIVPLSSSGGITISSSAASDVLVDVSGYYTAAGGTGTQFTAEAAPVRICDTRAGNPSGLSGGAAQCNGAGPAGGGQTLTIQVTGLASVPSSATAVVVNLTGVGPSAQTHLTVFPTPPVPTTSDLNLSPGMTRANLVVATLSPTGTISIYNNSGSVNVVVDVEGWYS